MDLGNILPPSDPELRKIVETLAQYVGKNGPQFEEMVKAREANNQQFTFLRGGEFYRYYASCVAAEQMKLSNRPTSASPATAPTAPVISNSSTPTSTSRFSQPPPTATIPTTIQGLAQGPSMSGTTPFGNAAEPSTLVTPQLPSFSGLPPHLQHQIQQQMALRFPPPSWQSSGTTDASRLPHVVAEQTHSSQNQHGINFPPPSLRPRFSQLPGQNSANFPVPSPHMFGPPPSYQGGMNAVPPPGIIRPGFGPSGIPPFQASFNNETSVNESQREARPWYELPSGLMVSLIRTEDSNYKSLDPKALVIPPPQPITERILRAVETFYAPPNSSQPRSAEGWEKLGLYDFYKAKDAAKKKLERGEMVRQYKPGQSRSPTPDSDYSRSRSRSRDRSYSRSRSRSASPKRRRISES